MTTTSPAAAVPSDYQPSQAVIYVASAPDATPVIVILGDVDLTNAHHLATTVESLRHEPRLIFDLGHVTFMDSAGLAVLAQAIGSGTAIEVRDPSPPARRLIELTGLADAIPIAA